MIDEDSDHYTLQQLSPRHRAKLEELKLSMQWTDLMVWYCHLELFVCKLFGGIF